MIESNPFGPTKLTGEDAQAFLEQTGLDKCPPHKWGRDGEHCVKCGASDWMADGTDDSQSVACGG